MKSQIRIPSDACVLVGDGRKGLLLRNTGSENQPKLQLEHLLEAPPNPPSRLQGSDRAPRVVAGGRRSGIEQTDMHDRAEAEFAKELASALEEMCRQGPARAIVIVAPPRTLAILRGALPASLHRQVVAEIDKDLTKFPVHEIERHLTAER